MPPAAPPRVRVSLWEWGQCALLTGNLAWTTLCLGGYLAETAVVTFALTTALLAVHFFARAINRESSAGFGACVHSAGWLFIPFLAYAAINAAWITPVPWLGWRDVLLWIQIVAVFWVTLNGLRSRAAQRVLFGTLVGLAVVGVIMACRQRFIDPHWLMLGRTQVDYYIGVSGSFGIPNSFAALLLLVLPACGAMAFRRGASAVQRIWWVWLAAVLAFGLVLTVSRGAWLGLALALCAWPLARAGGTWRRRAALGAIALVGVLAASATLYSTSPKFRLRVDAVVRDSGEVTRPFMWRGAWQLFRTHPAWGSGAGSYDVLFEQVRPENFQQRPVWAHNDYLNTLSDYGVAGFVLFFGAAVVVGIRCRWSGRGGEPAPFHAGAAGATASLSAFRRSSRFESPIITEALAVGLLAFSIQLFVDFHFKIPALGLAFATVAGIVVARTWPVLPSVTPAGPLATPSRALFSKLLYGLVIGAVLAGGFLFAFPRLTAEALRDRARQRIDRLARVAPTTPEYRDRLAAARAELARAVKLDPLNAQAWADRAYAAALRAHIAPAELPALAAEARAAADRAVELAPGCAEFWVRRGVAQDMQGRWFEGGTDFSQATVLAPHAAWTWFYLADHLSRRATEKGRTQAALDVCLRLDPWNASGLALRQRLANSLRVSP